MKKLASMFKTTAIGGVVFLVPLVVLGMILFKAFVLMKHLAEPFHSWIPTDRPWGVLAINLLVATILIFVCFLAGLMATSGFGKRVVGKIDRALLAVIPGYSFVKGMADSFSETESQARGFTPVLARFDDNAQLAFEVERTEGGMVVVYLPGAPNPWSGTVIQMEPERVSRLDISVPAAVKSIQRLGRGSL